MSPAYAPKAAARKVSGLYTCNCGYGTATVGGILHLIPSTSPCKACKPAAKGAICCPTAFRMVAFWLRCEEPVILLDDVLSELDAKRQDFLLNELHGCQVFITCCEKSNKEQLKDGKISVPPQSTVIIKSAE